MIEKKPTRTTARNFLKRVIKKCKPSSKKVFMCLCVLQAGLMASMSVSASNSKQQAIEELIRATGVDIMITNMAKQQSIAVIETNIGQILQKNHSQKKLNDAQRQQIIKVAHESSKTLFNDISTKETQGKIFGMYVFIMDKAYSEEEIKAQLAFFSSPAGKSLQAKQPQVMQALSANTFPIILQQAELVLNKQLKAKLEKEINKALIKK